MAGFETIVRPVVFPNIRPLPARVLAPPDDPTKGMAVIKGSTPSKLGGSRSWSVSISRQLPQEETKRVYDKERVYQKDDKGNINKNNYVDIERLSRIRIEGASDPPQRITFTAPPKVDNVETLEKDLVRDS
jgi:hypothetical protein